MLTKLWKANGNDTRPKRYRVIKNSETIKVGDWIVDESTGVANVDGVGEKILGYCTAIVTPDRISFEAKSVDSGDYSGTWTASSKQYAAAADNVTVDGVMAEYVPAREGDVFKATLDADKGTTTGSNKAGYYLSILTSNSAYLDESSAATSQASTQFRIYDPYDAGADTEVLVEVMVRETDQYTAD